MEIQSVKLVSFSPTGTSKTVVQAVARGIGHGNEELIDLTRPEVRKQQLQTPENALLIVAVPVYVGRVPDLVIEWLQSIQAEKTPAVCIVVYGNREFDDALLELRDILTERGCRPVAGAAFIGEHSFSTDDTPIAVSRPDADDVKQAEEFGRKVKETLQSIQTADQIPDLSVPGNHPYRVFEGALTMDIDVTDDCVQCGVCAEACPVEAIDPEDSRAHDQQKCILCCACIKACPENARSMRPGPIKDIAMNLHKMCSERKEPDVFF